MPASVYRNGFPGSPPGLNWGPQRYQTLPGEPLHTHVIIPEDTTLCLFSRWYNLVPDPDGAPGATRFPPLSAAFTIPPHDGFTIDRDDYWQAPVIGPSLGSLHGYVQPLVSQGSDDNATHGWGG